MSSTIEQIGNLPSEDDLRVCVERVNDLIFLYDDQGNHYAGGDVVQSFRMMSEEDRHRLIEAVSAKPLPSGQPAAVCISPIPLDGEGVRAAGASRSRASQSLRRLYQRIKI